MNTALNERTSAILTIAAAVATFGICVGAVVHENTVNDRTYQEAIATYEPAVDFTEYKPAN